jgi:hypothetical protein
VNRGDRDCESVMLYVVLPVGVAVLEREKVPERVMVVEVVSVRLEQVDAEDEGVADSEREGDEETVGDAECEEVEERRAEKLWDRLFVRLTDAVTQRDIEAVTVLDTEVR